MRIFVVVKPNSKENKIIKINDNKLLVYIKAPPIKNKANKELINMLSDYLGVGSSRIRIISGKHSKNKVIEIF